jgi:hypothetical protein
MVSEEIQMTTPKIPKGWRKLRRGSVVRKGDKFSDYALTNPWIDCHFTVGEKVGCRDFRGRTFIRKKA